ncbi:MAG: M56 family metallopeptidase [Pirellulales bacterium]
MNLLQYPLIASAPIFSEATTERLGWVLFHSLWQFMLVAILSQLILRLVNRSSASSQYALLVFSLAVCVVVPVATWFSLPADQAHVAMDGRTDAITQSPITLLHSPLGTNDPRAIVGDDHGLIEKQSSFSNRPSAENSHSDTETVDWWSGARESLRPWLMPMVIAWFLGVMICAMRPLLSWMAIRRWRRVGTTAVGHEVNELMLRLSERFAVGRTVEILQSTLVHAPLVFGYLRPVILLPTSLLTNLPTSQLEAIIAHELAHVRRHDFLVNLMQTIIETLFFYHPAIWWLSRRIRAERENCCDDLVVSVLHNRVEYGRALLAVEESPGFSSTLALGARDGSLLARVQRLAGLEATSRRPLVGAAAMIASGLLSAGTVLMISSVLFAAGDDDEKLFGKESNGIQIRLIPLSTDVSDETPELKNVASAFKRSEDMAFAVQLKNVSDKPIAVAGIRYGDAYAPETQGKLNTAMLAPHWFEFEFTDTAGKRIARTPHREFYRESLLADGSSVHVLAPGESLIEVLRPAKFMQPMDYELSPGKYRVQVHYHGPNDALREFVRKHWPNKPILNAWPHQATSNVADFSIEEPSNRTKQEDLIWGKPVEGLQAAIEVRLPDDAQGNPLAAPGVAVGTSLGITFHLRNVSDKPITFVSETGRQGDHVHVTDESGKEVEVKSAFFTGWPIDVAWKLMPGEVAQLSLLTPGLGSLDKPGAYKVRYTIRFNSRQQKDELGKIIFPRPGDYDKEVDTGETPLFLHEHKNKVSANGAIQTDRAISATDANIDMVIPPDAPASIRKESLEPPRVGDVPTADEQSQKTFATTNADIEKTVLDILRKPFNDDPAKGSWQLGAHDIDVHWKLRDVPQRTEVIQTLFKVIDRAVPATMDERRLAMEFLTGADPTNLVPRLKKEIEGAMADSAKPFAAYHEIEMLGRMGEQARSAVPLLVKLLDSKDRVAYDAAVNALIIIGARSPYVMNDLAEHTDDPVTVYQLGRYGPTAKPLGPLFVKLLDSPSNEIHSYAASALVRSGFDKARGLSVLIADVAAGKSEDRRRAATSLAALGSQAASMIPRLRAFENDPDPQVAKSVREAIVRIEKDDRIFTHAEEATKREAALEASAALNPQWEFKLRMLGGDEQIPLAGIEITATEGYGASQKKFGPFLTDASGTALCKLPQGFYTLHLDSKKELPWLHYENYWKDFPPPGMKQLNLRITGIGVEKWLGGDSRERS